jgi:uncharacterized protein (DUF58 family)
MQSNLEQSRIQHFTNLEFLARQVVEGFIVGLHKSPFHGFSVEFSEHRLYNSGESIKHIDWKLFGRTDRLYSKRYEEETNLRCQIVIDQSESMYFPVKENISIDNLDKITFSVYAAASLMHILRKQRDALGISLFSDKINLHSAAKSSSIHHKFLLGELEKLLVHHPVPAANNSTNVAESLHSIADNIHKRSLVVIFSDMFGRNYNSTEIFQALQHLKYCMHEVILFHVVDKQKELDLNYGSRPVRFIDVESGKEIKVVPAEVRKAYTESVNAYSKEIKMKCGQYRIDFVEADINRGFEQVLFPYLVKREKMY